MGDDKDWFYMMWLVSGGFQMTVSFAEDLWFQQFWWGTVKTFCFIPSSCFAPAQLPVNPLYDFRAAGSHERTNVKYWQCLSFPLVSRSGTPNQDAWATLLVVVFVSEHTDRDWVSSYPGGTWAVHSGSFQSRN